MTDITADSHEARETGLLVRENTVWDYADSHEAREPLLLALENALPLDTPDSVVTTTLRNLEANGWTLRSLVPTEPEPTHWFRDDESDAERHIYRTPEGGEVIIYGSREQANTMIAALRSVPTEPDAPEGLDPARLERALRWAGLRPNPFHTYEQAAKQLAGDYNSLPDHGYLPESR